MGRLSGQDKFGLVFCGIFMLVLGLGITSSGFVYDFVDPYDEVSKLGQANFSHTQYWLGVPLLFLGVYVTATSWCQVNCIIVFGLITTSLMLVLSICAVNLEGGWWRYVMNSAVFISDKDDCKDYGRTCSCSDDTRQFIYTCLLTAIFAFWGEVVFVRLPCNDVKYLAVIYTFLVGFSALAIPVCFLATFIYFRIFGWMSHISYVHLPNDYDGESVDGHYGREMGPANEVALGVYPH